LLLPDLPGSISVAGVASAHDHESVGRDEEWKDFKPGAPFVEPEIRRSANGELNTTLRMQYAYKNIGGSRLCVRTYEGAVPGPTLRLKLGDVLRIKLINDMPPNRDPKPIDHSLPHQVDDRQRPAERARNGSITFRSRFLDFTGKYMLHCHMMNHEELGMMQVVEVYADD
jgi:FtsP/CotA-like multicopper oxidase with cupredoxin domain